MSSDSGGVRVDVGIPTGGRATYLRHAVGSALGQSISAIRVTVGENGPGNPAVAEALAPFSADPRLTHVVHGVDLGPTRNFMRVAEGSAPYLAILHDDDLWEPDFLRRRVEFLDAHPTCGFVFSGCVIIDSAGVARDIWDMELAPGVHTPKVFLPVIYEHNLVPVPTVLVRRSAYDAVGAEFRNILFNDHELWLRLGSEFDVGYISTIDASYRVHQAQTTSENLRQLGEYRIEFQEAIQQELGDRIPASLRRRAAAAAHLHVAADSIESGRPVHALRELGRAVASAPGFITRPREVRRAGLLAAASICGPPGRALWNRRRDLGRRRADSQAARRVVALRAKYRIGAEPAFSVVVPARNAESSIVQTIDSILMQSFQDFEIIVVDDGSTDATGERAHAAGGNRLRIEQSTGEGVSAARNVGIKAARGRFVSFLDADDFWLPSYLSEMKQAFDREPELGLVFTDAWVFDEAVRAIRRQPMMERRRPAGALPEDPDALFSLLLEGNFVYTSATVPRAVLDTVSGYDEVLARAEDYDLWLRILEASYPAAYRPGPLAVYRLREGSLSTDQLAMLKGERSAMENLLARDALSDSHRNIVAARAVELSARIMLLEAGATRRSVLRRLQARLQRLAREGSLYRTPPPEVTGAFPGLVYPERGFVRMSKSVARAPGAVRVSSRDPRAANAPGSRS